MVTVGEDATARVWEAATGKAIGEPLRHEGLVYAASFSPDGRFVVTASADGDRAAMGGGDGQTHRRALRHEDWFLARHSARMEDLWSLQVRGRHGTSVPLV